MTIELDELAQFNQARWDALAQANIEFSRPMLDIDPEAARRFLDPDGMLGDVRGQHVLCLASGGGQQSVAFALLGAHVTVFDLSTVQLDRDRKAAAHYQYTINIVQGDMRDLSHFDDDAFDIVYHAYSVNFVPDLQPVFSEVARVIRPDGLYRIEWHNPFTQTIDDNVWTEQGYLIKHLYEDGRDMSELYPEWDVVGDDGVSRQLEGPKAFVHSLSTMVNTLAANGFAIIHAREATGDETAPKPGTWPHFMAVTAPWLTLWSIYRPDLCQLRSVSSLHVAA